MLIGMGHRNVLIRGACKESVEHVIFECKSYDSHRQIFVDYLTHPYFMYKPLPCARLGISSISLRVRLVANNITTKCTVVRNAFANYLTTVCLTDIGLMR